MPRPDVLQGSIDDLNRPLVRIDAPGFSDPLVAFIDTGFNGAMIVDEQQAQKLGFRVSPSWRTSVRLASQREEHFLLARGSFPWFGEQLTISAYVLIETPQARRARIARKTEEEILIGTELLAACRLEIDFPARKVVLEKTA